MTATIVQNLPDMYKSMVDKDLETHKPEELRAILRYHQHEARRIQGQLDGSFASQNPLSVEVEMANR